jgi:hypothetical protein
MFCFLEINECQSTQDNLCDQTCTNTAGSYTCSCLAGYSFTSPVTCTGLYAVIYTFILYHNNWNGHVTQKSCYSNHKEEFPTEKLTPFCYYFARQGNFARHQLQRNKKIEVTWVIQKYLKIQ